MRKRLHCRSEGGVVGSNRPGFIRIDNVHQGDLDGTNGRARSPLEFRLMHWGIWGGLPSRRPIIASGATMGIE